MLINRRNFVMYSPLNVKLEVGETRHIDHISWGFELKAFLGSNALPQGRDSWSKEFQNFISEFS